MAYKTSHDYARLIELLDGKKIVLVIVGTGSFFASIDAWKGYYIGHSWLNHGIEFSLFASKSAEAFAAFCRERNLEFFDPDDCTGCVQPGRDGRTQTALRPAGETKAAKCSVWHSSKDVPDGYNRYVLAVTVNDTWVKMSVCDLTAFLSGMHAPMIQKWAFIDELEAL